MTFLAGVKKMAIVIPLFNTDTTDENNETFRVSLASPTFATIGQKSSTVVTITDNDAPPKVGFTLLNSSFSEAAGTVTIAVSLSGISEKSVSVQFAFKPGGTTTTADYTFTPGTLTFAPGETVKFIVTNSGSSNLRSCLNSTTPANGVVVGALTTTDYRIGILSSENNPDPTDKFAFIKLDGTAVNEDALNRQTAIDGKYAFAYELALHTNVSTTITPTAVQALYDQIGVDLGNPTISNLRGVYALRGGAFAQTTFPTQIGKGLRSTGTTAASCAPFSF